MFKTCNIGDFILDGGGLVVDEAVVECRRNHVVFDVCLPHLVLIEQISKTKHNAILQVSIFHASGFSRGRGTSILFATLYTHSSWGQHQLLRRFDTASFYKRCCKILSVPNQRRLSSRKSKTCPMPSIDLIQHCVR